MWGRDVGEEGERTERGLQARWAAMLWAEHGAEPSWRYGLSGEKEGGSWARGERGWESWAGRVGVGPRKRAGRAG